MRTIRRSFAVALCAAAPFATACKHKDRETVRVDASNATFAKRDSAQALGPGDLRIATTDSVLELALVGDSLFAGFGAATRAKIKHATDTTRVEGSGLGASIEKMVKSTVAGALDHEMHFPLSDISNIEYEDGLLVFYDKNGKRMHFLERDRGKEHPSQFNPSDAKGFIAVFKSKTGRS